MNDLISRQAAIDAIDKIFPADPMRNDYTQGITCGAALAEEYIKQLPTAQPQRTGHWIEDDDEMFVICSECGEKNDYISAYCPDCGARMEDER